MAANILALAFVVVGVPWLVGLSFLDAFVLIPFACMPVFFVAALDTGRSPGQAALKGWLYGLVVLAGSLITVNVLHWHGSALLPPWEILFAAGSLSLAACAVTAGARTWVPPRTMRLALVAIVLGVIFGYRALPTKWVAPLEADLSTGGVARKTLMVAAFLAVVAGVLLNRAPNRPRAQ